MGKPSLFYRLREWLAGIAFDVFLLCRRMTAEQYFDMLDTERGLTLHAAEADTTEALIEEIATYVEENLEWNEREGFVRFLRERLLR